VEDFVEQESIDLFGGERSDEVFVIEDVFAVGGGGGAFLGREEAGEHGEGGEEWGFHSQSQDGGADEVLGSGGHFGISRELKSDRTKNIMCDHFSIVPN
jgi:hypothetical protein